jgi:hypothetical protein
MNRLQRTGLALIVPAMLVVSTPTAAAADPGITLIGKGTVAGDRLDLSGLGGEICQAGAPDNCVPQAIFGGYGSDISYSGFDNVFVAAPDRGPFDGLTDVPYVDRLNFLHITTEVGAAFPNITTTLLSTRLLRDEDGLRFVGSAGDFEQRFDPEGIRVAPDGTMYISDEYGPYILQFNRQGNLQRRIAIPDDFAIANPSGNPTEELTGNTSGRQANRGMEGLAISPDGSTLYGIMQNALLQDNALVPGTTDRQSVYTRILKVDLVTGDTAEYVYPLVAANRGQGVSEILAVNDHEFLVLERDNRSYLATPSTEPTRKSIYRIDITAATDVSDVTLPATGALPAGVVPVTKSMFIDLLDPAFGLKAGIAEKPEGLAWGPDLADGRHVLYVITDNDLNPDLATQLYSFAITDAAADVEAQRLSGPLFPRGQLKQLVP